MEESFVREEIWLGLLSDFAVTVAAKSKNATHFLKIFSALFSENMAMQPCAV